MRLNKDLKRALDNQPQLTSQELNELIGKAKAGCLVAQNKIIEANLRLVYHFAKELKQALNKIAVIDLDDLINEGAIGMAEAIQKFDLTKEIKFSYFAGYYIKKNIMATLMDDSKLIRIPQNKQRSLKKIADVIEKMYSENEGIVDEYELIENKEYTKDYFNYFFNQYDYTSVDDDYELFDSNGFDFLIQDEAKDLKFKLTKGMEKLTDDERLVIFHLHGIDGCEILNGVELGELLNVTKQRVSQIKKSAFKKLNEGLKDEI